MFTQIIRKNGAVVIPLCLWFLGISFLLPTGVCSREAEEYAVKAAFVLNFVKVTTWPDNTFNDTPGIINLCLVGDDTLLAATFQSIDGKEVGERRLRVHVTSPAGDCRGCEVFFVGNSIDHAYLLRFFAALKERPVLIIGETPDFARIGGIINFISKNGKLHFEINPQEVERHGLKISSRILQLATIVESD